MRELQGRLTGRANDIVAGLRVLRGIGGEPEFAERYPILTFASGPTNSMRGGAFLSGAQNAVIVDIGGTTSDIGVLVKGFPREAATEVEIADVRTNFRMPDIISIGVGAGAPAA